MQNKTFRVPNIGCDGCVGKIKSELGAIAGVAQVEGDTQTKLVTVLWQEPATWQEIEKRLADSDYAPAPLSVRTREIGMDKGDLKTP